jgi:Alpha-glutamyl/putrescinyl thymine pyrophosphorylase clade 3
MPLFCRHNRLTANCPICSREMEANLRSQAPPRARPASGTGGARASTARRARPAAGRPGGVVTRRLARAADDGYRNPLVPGLRATADAERLAAALAAAAARLQPPGPYPEVAAEPDVEEATWLAFLLALAGPDAPALQAEILAARPAWGAGEVPDLPPERARAAVAYRAWVGRAGSQAAAFTGEPAWTPQRRFARVFERLALPGFSRAGRYELLAALGAAGTYPLEAGELFLARADDPTADAAKRLLVSGDPLLLERRARDLAEACAVPIAALDRGLAVWGTPGDAADLAAEVPAAIRSALDLR